MDGLKAAEEQRPTLTFSGCHHHLLELSNLPNNHLVSCSGCTLPIPGGRGYYTCQSCSFSLHSYCFKMPLCHPAHELRLSSSMTSRSRVFAYPIAPDGGSLISYYCPFCTVHFHSLCLLRAVSISRSSHPLRDLSLKFHAECSVITSAVMTAQNSPTAGSLDGAAPQPTPSTVYPLLLTDYGMPHQESTVIQLDQLTANIVIRMGTDPVHPQFDGSGYQLPMGNEIRRSQPRPQVTVGGYLNTVIFPSIKTTVPVAPGTGKGAGVAIGTPLMAGVGSGIEEGKGQELIPSSTIGFGHRFFRFFGSELTPMNSWEHRLLCLFICFFVFLFVYLGYSTELSIWNL